MENNSESYERIKRALFSKYEIKRLIASGGMGNIYLGVHRALHKHVAIKVIHYGYSKNDVFRTRFFREAKLAAGLEHSGIIDIYDFGNIDGVDYIIMSYIPGQTLQQKLKKQGRLDIKTCLKFMISMTDAIAFAHQKNIIHRDIKPSNFLIDNRQSIVLTDFGISKDLMDANLTSVGTLLGSPKYICPEVIQGERADKRSDLYSLGIVFYEMITGKYPFEKKHVGGIYYSQLFDIPIRPEVIVPSLPKTIGDIIMQLLAKKPENRFQTADELLVEIKKFNDSLTLDLKIDITGELEQLRKPSDNSLKQAGSIADQDLKIQKPNQGRNPFVFFKPLVGRYLAVVLLLMGFVAMTSFRPKMMSFDNPNYLVRQQNRWLYQSGLKELLNLGSENAADYIELGVEKKEFRVGEAIHYRIKVKKDCYAVVVCIDSLGNINQIYPNRYYMDNHVEAGRDYLIPAPDSTISLKINGPPGTEKIVAWVSETEFELFPYDFSQNYFYQLDDSDTAGLTRLNHLAAILDKTDIYRQQLCYSIIMK